MAPNTSGVSVEGDEAESTGSTQAASFARSTAEDARGKRKAAEKALLDGVCKSLRADITIVMDTGKFKEAKGKMDELSKL